MICQKPMQIGSPNLADVFHYQSRKPTYFGVKRSKIKVTSHNKSVPVLGQNAILPLAAYISHAGFSPLKRPAAQVMLVTTMLLLQNINHNARQTDHRFFRAWSFSQSVSGKNIAGVGHDASSCGYSKQHLTFDQNFGKCRPISTILSLTDSWGNTANIRYQDSPLHLTYVPTLPCETVATAADFNRILHVRPQNLSCRIWGRLNSSGIKIGKTIRRCEKRIPDTRELWTSGV